MKKALFFGLIISIGFFSCKKETEESLNTQPGPANRIVNTDLNNRVTYHNEPIALSGKRGTTNTTQFTYVAEVSSPIVNGATLSATGIAFQGNKAYVSYHWNGNDGDYGGALEVIDITNPEQPQLISSVFFTDADLNEVYVEGDKAYVVGGRDVYSSGYDQSLTNGGIVEVIDLQSGLLTNITQQSYLPSYSGNSVFKNGNSLLVAAGNTGGGAFEVSLAQNNYLALTDADYYNNSKFGVGDNGKLVFLEGGPTSKIHVHNNTFSPVGKSTISLSSSQSPLNGKGVLFVEGDQAYVSGGSFGLFEYDLSSSSNTPVRSFDAGGNGFVNGVGADNEFVFVANGHDGMFILNRSDFAQRAVFTFTGSANYVAANGQNVFIANGVGGLKILAKSSPVNPYCTNESAFEPYNGNPGIVRLTAMGNYLENGQFGKRWRIRNETNQQVTVTWDIYGSPLNGQFTVPAMTALHFTSHFTGGTGSGGTMRLFNNGNQIQVKAHGGSTKDLSTCGGNSGPSKYSLYFDGTNDAAGKIQQLTNDRTFTISAWFKSDGTTGNSDRVIFGLANAQLPNLQFGVRLEKENNSNLAGKLIMRSRYQQNSGNQTVSSFRYDDGNWHHVAAVYDGTDMLLYADGIYLGAQPILMNADITQTNTWAVGCWPDVTPKSFFKGNIDEVSFWSEALTTAEVQSIYANNWNFNVSSMTNYWNFNEGSGNTIIDLQGNSNGTITGAAYSSNTPY